jgi:hypothetical protein
MNLEIRHYRAAESRQARESRECSSSGSAVAERKGRLNKCILAKPYHQFMWRMRYGIHSKELFTCLP